MVAFGDYRHERLWERLRVGEQSSGMGRVSGKQRSAPTGNQRLLIAKRREKQWTNGVSVS